MRLAGLFAEVMAASAMAAAPQPAERPTPPPVIRPLPPPPVAVSSWVKASGVVGPKRIQLFVQGDRAAIATTGNSLSDRPQVYPLDGYNIVLALLADRNFEFLWPELTKWAGPDLGLQRERLRRQAEAITYRGMTPSPVLPAESATSAGLANMIRLTSIYMQIGQTPLAKAVLESWLAKSEPKGKGSQATADWILAKARLASVMQFAGEVEQSYRHYQDIQTRAGKSEHALNGMVNHAAVLAENGRHAEALRLIDAAWERFRRAGDEQIAGSERQFAWIRACALDGLGRPAEADAAYAVVRNSAQVFDRDFITDSKETIEWRAHWCRRREAELKAFLLQELASDRPTMAVLALQPAYRSERENPALLAKMRADPDIRAAIARRMRTLPEAIVPALNKHR